MEDSAVRTLQNLMRHRRAIITLVLLGTFFAVGIYLSYNYAIVALSVTAPPSVSGKDVQAYANHDDTSSAISSGGISIIPRNTSSLSIVTKNKQMRTITALTIPWYGLVSKHVTLTTDTNADKVAFRSSLYNTCASYDTIADRLLTFACSGNSGLTYYDISTNVWLNRLITKVDINGQVSPYRGGVIGLSSINDRDSLSRPAPIEYISPTGSRHHYAFPDNFIQYDDFSDITIVTDPTDPSNSHFILIAKGVIYLASVNTNDDVSYTTLSPPSNYNSMSNQTICTFKNVNVYCYRGSIATDDTHSPSSSFQPTIIHASFDNSNTQSFSTDRQIADTLYLTTSGLLFSKNYKSLFYLKRVGDTYISQQISNNVDDAQADTKMYFIDDTGILTYNTTTAVSTQIFRSANILPKHIIPSGGKVFILGYIANNNTYTTYAWTLNGETDSSYRKRLIDILPVFSNSGIYGDTDLVGNDINITVRYDKSAGANSIHQQKQATLDNLKLMGVNTSEVTLTNP